MPRRPLLEFEKPLVELEQQIEPLLRSEDRSISHTSKEVYRLLSQ